jgi:hypothetical protein
MVGQMRDLEQSTSAQSMPPACAKAAIGNSANAIAPSTRDNRIIPGILAQ